MQFPENVKYTKDHEWMRVEGTTGTIGVTEYAQGELGDVVFVELLKVGAKLEKGKAFGTIEAVKAVSDLYAPVSGEVVEINAAIATAPESVNKDPYGAGWMVKIRLSNAADAATLLDAAEYRALTGK